MGNVERCDKTLPLNEMIFYVRRDARLRERWKTDLEGLAREFGLSREEYEAMRDRLIAARPDVIVAFSNDHLLNWPINNTPEYTVGIGDEHVGPADWYDEWLALDKYRIAGHPALARHLVNEGARRGLAFAYLRDMQFDDGFSVPMHYLNPEGRIPLVPVSMNCTVPPIPTSERAYHVGTVVREAL